MHPELVRRPATLLTTMVLPSEYHHARGWSARRLAMAAGLRVRKVCPILAQHDALAAKESGFRNGPPVLTKIADEAKRRTGSMSQEIGRAPASFTLMVSGSMLERRLRFAGAERCATIVDGAVVWKNGGSWQDYRASDWREFLAVMHEKSRSAIRSRWRRSRSCRPIAER